MKSLISLVVGCVLCVGLFAQTNNRFPAPLGLDRVLTGTVSRAAKKDAPKSADGNNTVTYVLSVEGNRYRLHGHERQLKHLLGKKARITGNVVENDVTVSSVAAASE